jgi:hypothetical protein
MTGTLRHGRAAGSIERAAPLPVTLGDSDQRAVGSWRDVTTTAGPKSDAVAAVALD